MTDAQTQQASSQPQTLSLQQQIIGAAQLTSTPTSISSDSVPKSIDVAAQQESSASEKKDDRTVPVRKRLSLACTTCRQRKVKCDGGRPACRTCAKFSWPCIYQPSNRKRGPRPRALALMDGSMPYSTRSHWAIPHGYYPPYAVPGRSPMSPPPLPPQLMAPHFGAPHHPDIPQNGAPLRLDPAFQQPGGYNYDSYSSYGDYMANTGAIRIRPPPSQYMHSPGVAYPPPPMAARHSGYTSPHSSTHPYAGRGYQQHMPPSSLEAAHAMPPQSHFSPHAGASGSPPFARPLQSGISDRHGSGPAQPMSPPGHYPSHPHQQQHPPPSLLPTVHVGVGETAPDKAMHEKASPAISSAAGQLHGKVEAPPPANGDATHRACLKPSADTPSLGSPAPQQHMRVSGQPYISVAAPYAAEMQSPSAGAGTHSSLAIYAQNKSDTPIRRNNDTNVTMLTPASSAAIAAAPKHADYSRAGRMVLSSPPQPTSAAQNGSAASKPTPGYPTSLGTTPMTVPISSTASFARPAQSTQHYNHPLENNSGYASIDNRAAHCSPRESRSYTTHAAAAASLSPTPLSKPLPFTSNGASRPQLPPLSEVLGKDYRLMMPPGNSTSNNNNDADTNNSSISISNSGGMQYMAEKRPMTASMPLSATEVDRFLPPTSHRRDSFRD
ncbi:hypothetical protein EV175_004880 [Coemansia sp. RSA 1933]|nr:hypothetical protein EV175_004880 [Coemansia sp. RSA 1933]